VNAQLLVAGSLLLIAAAVHGAGGEVLVVRKLTDLPPTPIGGRSMTRIMVRVTWHIVTIAFVTLGAGLTVCGGLASGAACDGIGLAAASAFTAISALTFAVAFREFGFRQSLRIALLRHQAPLVFVAVAALAWWGIGSG
jgi:hypothetical protein